MKKLPNIQPNPYFVKLLLSKKLNKVLGYLRNFQKYLVKNGRGIEKEKNRRIW
jgi:hypothetical protein